MDTENNQRESEFKLHLGAAEISSRKRWLEFTEQDEELIRTELEPILSQGIDNLIASMYGHFLAMEETRSFFPDDQTLRRAQLAQKDYFLRFSRGDYQLNYVEDRLRVGSTHHKIDLDPKWYIGAYNRVLSWMMPQLLDRFGSDPAKLQQVLTAVLKLVFFDMGLAIECYIAAKEHSLRKHRDSLKELETERRVTRSILENAPIGIVSLSESFVCLECNDEFLAMIACESTEKIIGRTIFEVLPELDRMHFEALLNLGQPARQQAQLLVLNKNGIRQEAYWDWSAWPVRAEAGKLSGFVSMFSDATDRVLLQQQREDFVATLTHDLKTPVSATNRAIQFILDGDFGAVSDEQKEVLETMLQSNKALYSLVQTLLDVYRFDSGVKEFNMRKTNLSGTITQIVTEIMPLAQERGVSLKATLRADSHDVLCDEEEIRRVVQNLVDNSLKFTSAGGKITVTMTQDDNKTVISVADTGKGIPEENKPKLFQRFWQAGSTGRYYASTGLGLYLCRRIVEGHKGVIWCDSTLGKGSTFHVQLPFQVPADD